MTSRWLSADKYGVEELQSTAYHLLTEQFGPIPKGYGICTSPQVSLHPGLEYLGAVSVDVVISESKISK